MTPEFQDALSEVREALPDHLPGCSHTACVPGCHWPALARIESEVARLEEDTAHHRAKYELEHDKVNALEAKLARLTEERDEALEDVSAERDAKEAGRHLREAAESEATTWRRKFGRAAHELNEAEAKLARLAELSDGALQAAWDAEQVGDELRRENARLKQFEVALLRVLSIARNGPGPGTTPEEALNTVAGYIDRRLVALAAEGGGDRE